MNVEYGFRIPVFGLSADRPYLDPYIYPQHGNWAEGVAEDLWGQLKIIIMRNTPNS